MNRHQALASALDDELYDDALDRADPKGNTVGSAGTSGTIGCICGTVGSALTAGTAGSRA